MTKEIIEAVVSGINYILIISEISEVVEEKNKAVRAQDFALAVKWRENENKLRLKLPKVEDLKAVRNRLTLSIETNEQRPKV
jgi:hypothetical protein